MAANLSEADAVLKLGPGTAPEKSAEKAPTCKPSNYNRPLLVIHGTADAVVHLKNVERLKTDFFGAAKSAEKVAGETNGLKFSTEDFKEGERLRGRIVLIEGLGHAWAGYREQMKHAAVFAPNGKFPLSVPFFSAEGPNSTALIYEFFKTTTN